jgi:uncharacterized protein YbjQ (UPF0145 family)
MICITTNEIPGKKVAKTLGLVKGNTIRARHLGRDIGAFFKNVVGGEIEDYTKMMAEAREQATDRMIQEAEAINADAIIGIRFATSYMMSSASEILVYGTAVTLE